MAMYGTNAPSFQQSASGSRFVIRHTCARSRPEIPALFTAWAGRAFHLTAETRKPAAEAPTRKTKEESWRIPPILPGSPGHLQTWPSLIESHPEGKPIFNTTPVPKTNTPEPPPPPPPSPQKLPPTWDPTLWPTLDRVLFPWEAPMSPIEYAVSTFLAKEHPAIHEQVILTALRAAGLIEEELEQLPGSGSPVDTQPPSATEEDQNK